LKKNQITSIEACIYFALSQKNIDKIVVGINSSNELQEILDIITINKNKILYPQGCIDKNLINPINWKI
jgi:predicted aldo/keto reductase-like oxidoreductase